MAGTHPLAHGHEVEVSAGARYQLLHEGLRVLARREPTFALHVHVGVPDPDLAIRAVDRLRAHLPLILALSANSPFWAGRDTDMASVRTPLFQAFPRAGVPRRCGSYETYVERLDVLLRAGAFPEPTFVWSDVRLQPRFGTVEVRVADAQTGVAEVGAIAAVIQALVRIEATDELADEALVEAQEVIEENRFLAARDGMAAELVDPAAGARAGHRAVRGGARRLLRPRRRARLARRAGGGGRPRPALGGRAPAPAGASTGWRGCCPRSGMPSWTPPRSWPRWPRSSPPLGREVPVAVRVVAQELRERDRRGR